MRTVDHRAHKSLMQRFDEAIRRCFERIIGTSLSNHQWAQATLPVSMGGVGLRSALLHSAGAFTSSYCDSSSIIEDIIGKTKPFQDEELLSLINSLAGEQYSMESIQLASQKSISHAIDNKFEKEIVHNVEDTRVKARLKAVSMKHAGDWLNTVPVKALGLHLRPLEFITAIKYHLGVKVYPAAGPCIACTEDSDQFGDHSVGCAKEGERIYRHNSLRDVLYTTAKQACLSPAKEENSLLPGSDAKPADVFIPGWVNGRDAAFDVSVSPLQSQLIQKASEENGSAASKRFKDKMNKYHTSCDMEGIQFYPIIVETFGGWHPESEAQIRNLGDQLASRTGGDTDETCRHLFQRLSILLARGNANLILRRTPDHADPEIDGDLDVDIQP